MLLSPSQVLVNRYRVIGLLGQGGMAAVYCAHDRTLDRLVAIKQLRPDPYASEKAVDQARQQFMREAQILATLDHPTLPRVTDYFDSDGIEYLVMDYVEGQTLSDVVSKQGGGLGETQVLAWADQLLSALQYIHLHGIIHRDVKPSNIRLTPDGRIFLVDFGLVKLFDPTNPKTATMMHGLGTPEYAPPEQYDARLGHTDPRSDVYALGATMYHLLTGQAPATATQRVSDPKSFQPLRALGARVSGDVEQAILRAMELPRAKRFSSAGEMRETLRQARRLVPVEDEHTRRLPPWVASGRGRLARRVAPFAVVALLIAGGLFGLTRGSASSALPPSATAAALPGLSPQAATATPTPTARPSRTPTRRATSSEGLNQGNSIDEQATEESALPASATASPTAILPLPARTQTLTSTPTLTATREPNQRTNSPTPTASRTPTPSETPTPSATATATDRPTPGDSPTPTPSPTT
jgi:serine/threonine-protein kinase